MASLTTSMQPVTRSVMSLVVVPSVSCAGCMLSAMLWKSFFTLCGVVCQLSVWWMAWPSKKMVLTWSFVMLSSGPR